MCVYCQYVSQGVYIFLSFHVQIYKGLKWSIRIIHVMSSFFVFCKGGWVHSLFEVVGICHWTGYDFPYRQWGDKTL